MPRRDVPITSVKTSGEQIGKQCQGQKTEENRGPLESQEAALNRLTHSHSVLSSSAGAAAQKATKIYEEELKCPATGQQMRLGLGEALS